jgi:RNA polymerase-interacting CarD/CdnL/TRCF family regulator
MTIQHRSTAAGPLAFRVQETLASAPASLPADSKKRRQLLERKLQWGDAFRMAQVVRDLTWRQRQGKANRQDVRLLARANRKLAGWFARQTGQDRTWVRQKLQGTVERTIARLQ